MRPASWRKLLIKAMGRVLAALFVFILAVGQPAPLSKVFRTLPGAGVHPAYADEEDEAGAEDDAVGDDPAADDTGGDDADTENDADTAGTDSYTDVDDPRVTDMLGKLDRVTAYDDETVDEAYNRGAFYAGDPERLVFAEPVEYEDSKPVRMLWLGDSIINRYEMAWLFAELFDDNNIKLDVTVHAEDEASLQEHVDSEEEMDELENGDFDIVLLQEESHEIRDNTDVTIDLVKEMMDIAPETTRFYLYETMAYRGQSYNQDIFHDKYTEVGKETGVPVIYAGDYYMNVIDAHPGWEMYDNLQHPSAYGYCSLIVFLYDQLEDEIRKIYTERNPGSMTFSCKGMPDQENMAGALYIVKDSMGDEAGAFITDETGAGYAAEIAKDGENSTLFFGGGESLQRSYNGKVYTRTESREISLPSQAVYTLCQALAPVSGAYVIDRSEKLNDIMYKIREREITPVSHALTMNRDFLTFEDYRIEMIRKGFGKLEAVTQLPSELTYTSSDPSVVRVNEDGMLIAGRPGVALVTVKCSNGITRRCRVEVRLI